MVDGWHMATHALAIAFTGLVLVRKRASRGFKAAVTSLNVGLLAFAGLFTLVEAGRSLWAPGVIDVRLGLLSGGGGLLINMLCAWIFRTQFDLSNVGVRSAYLHGVRPQSDTTNVT